MNAIAGVPGKPIVGNVLQLKNNDMHRVFTSWAEKYGDIYSIRLGTSNYAVLTAPELAKEVRQLCLQSSSLLQLAHLPLCF